MSGFALTIRTGDPALDERQVAHYRQQAQASGLVFHADPLPGGGWAVRGEAPVGATLPSNVGEYRPSQAPPAVAGSPHESLPQPVMGTLPSRLGQPKGQPPRPLPEVYMATPGGICQSCGRSGPTRSVSFHQNVGMLVMRSHRSVNGYLCKFCIDAFFFRMTGITLLFGWWGVISFVTTLLFLPMNVVNWARTIGMQTPAEDAASVAARRTRGTVQIAIGGLVSLVAAAFTISGLLIVVGEPDVEAGIEAASIGLVLGALAFVFIAFGIRARLKATSVERRLQGALIRN
jgi:hypothetical protein